MGSNENLRTAILLPHPLPSSPSALQCQDLPAPNQARVKCVHPFGASRYQSACSFACAEGFLLVGARELRCLATGSWSAAPPECQGRRPFPRLGMMDILEAVTVWRQKGEMDWKTHEPGDSECRCQEGLGRSTGAGRWAVGDGMALPAAHQGLQ